MYNQLIERNAIESLLNICQDEQPQYDPEYERELSIILKRTITERPQKKNEPSVRQMTISHRSPPRIQPEFRLKTEIRSKSRPAKLRRIPQNIPQITLKQNVKPLTRSFRDLNHKHQTPLKTPIVSLQHTTTFSFLNQSETQNPVLKYQKKSNYIPRFVLKLRQTQYHSK